MAGLRAEQIGDVDEGDNVATPEVDELGLTPEERATFDDMKEADRSLPAGPESDDPEPAAETPAGVEATPEAPEAAGEPPKPKPKPEPEEPDDEEPDTVVTDPRTGKQQRTISFGKHQRLLKKEREAAEALRAAAEESKINQAKLAERLAILNDALTAPQQQPAPTPEQMEYQRQQEIAQNPMLEETIDPSVDLAAAINQMQRRQMFMAQATMYQQETTQEQLEDQAMLRDFTRDAQMYANSEEGQHFFGPEGAYQFLKNSRLAELSISLFDKDATDPNEKFTQQEINKMISDFNTEEKWVVNNALRAGKSPAKAIMRLAKGRGWKPPQAAAAAAASPTSVAAAAPPPRQEPARAAAGSRNAVAQIKAERDGAALSRSLSDGGGAPPGEPLSMEQLLKMGDEEFGIYIDNLPPAKLQAIMGREFPRRE